MHCHVKCCNRVKELYNGTATQSESPNLSCNNARYCSTSGLEHVNTRIESSFIQGCQTENPKQTRIDYRKSSFENAGPRSSDSPPQFARGSRCAGTLYQAHPQRMVEVDEHETVSTIPVFLLQRGKCTFATNFSLTTAGLP